MNTTCRFPSVLILLVSFTAAAADDSSWPTPLRGAVNGTATVKSNRFLEIPESVSSTRDQEGMAQFEVAKAAPTVELAFHQQLGSDPANRRLWSSWGDICLASDGRVYCAIGDHGHDQKGDARCFVYVWDPKQKQLRQIIDMSQIVPPRPGVPAWSKVHAKIDEGPDGAIYFSCTLNNGHNAGSDTYGFDDQLPGGQIYRYDPATGQTTTFANLPKRHCTATSLFDRQRNIWWCNLEGAANSNKLWGFNLKTRKEVYLGEDGSVSFNRAFALLNDGQILYNSPTGLSRLDPVTKKATATRSSIPDSPGMRCASVTRDDRVFGVSQLTNQLFQYDVKKDELKLLGPNWLKGVYTAVCDLSPDHRFLYYLPGSHGQAWKNGTPVIQYELATGRRKVLAFLASTLESECDYVPGGTYGMKVSADGGTIYVNFNGHPPDSLRPAKMKPIGFCLTAFAAIHIPASER